MRACRTHGKTPPFILLIIWMICGCSTSVTDELAPLFQNAVADVSYVGDAQCASCHEQEYEGYQTHAMARGFFRLTEETAVEDYSGIAIHHAATGFYYVARVEGDRFVQEEYRLGPSGDKTHQLIRTMDYVVGSGSAARTYLTEVDGRLYELPLTWYTQANQGAGRWDFSPGYQETNGRFDRTIPPGCMSCHNGTSPPVAHVQGMYESLSLGIGCEQCHGPGQLHVEARLADPEPEDSVDLTIVNPARLPIDLRLDVCQQCHTSGAVSVLRDGESANSFRPSQRLDQHVAIFGIAGTDPTSIGVISHADRMKQSACFKISGVMDCVTCHNPHEGFRDFGPEYFNSTCISCHASEGLQTALASSESQSDHTSQSNCFSCHMPKVAADDAPHSSFTDHNIRVVQENGVSVSGGSAPAVELTPYFERDRDGIEAGVYTAMAYIVFGRQNGDQSVLRRGATMLARALPEKPELGEAQYLLGFARVQLGEAAAAIPPLEESIRLNPDIPERLNTLAQAYEATGKDPGSIEQLYRRALAIRPGIASIRVNLGRFLEAQGNVDGAQAEYEQARIDEPWLASAHYNAGTVLLRLGRLAEGERALLETVHLDPDHSDALTNLGVLAGTKGLTNEATGYFRRAVEADPQNANALANLALAIANGGDLAQARQYAQRALVINPNHATAQQVMEAR